MREITIGSVKDALLAAGLKQFWQGIDVKPSQLDKVSPVIAIDVRYHDVTFDELSAISEALGTRHINLDNQVREGGYCETCRYSYSVTIITVMGAVLKDLPDEAS